jgi:cyclophilin family peptidyl-prolyl cis-trans isomerase
MRRRHLLAGAILFMTATTAAGTARAAEPENTLVIDLSTGGKVVIELFPDVAPKHVARVKELAREGFYDGIVFHRVIPGFMAQTGDPTGTGTGGSNKGNVMAEFNKKPFERGTVGAARTNNPNSADSQFFICFAPAPHLNGQYTVWGQVIEGMDAVDGIAEGEPPANPTKMTKVRVGSDAG